MSLPDYTLLHWKQIFLVISLTVTLIFAKEVPLSGPAQDPQAPARVDSKEELMPNEGEQSTSFLAVFKAFKNLPPGMPSVLLVTSLTWVCTQLVGFELEISVDELLELLCCFLVACSCHGFPSSSTTPIGWAGKSIMGIQREPLPRSMPTTEASDKEHLVCC